MRRPRTLAVPALATLSLLVPAVVAASPSIAVERAATAVPPVAGSAPAADVAADTYLVGAGVHDITGAVAETGAFGYAAQQEMNGLQERLYSHAYIVGDPATGKRVVFVSADLGVMFQSLKVAVVKELRARYGETYTDDNVMLTATHTHVGTSGLSHETLYQVAGNDSKGYGYSSQNFTAVVSGIVASIGKAHANLEPGTVRIATGDLTGATRNRSAKAYATNKDAKRYPANVDTRMTQLMLTSAKGRPVGMVNWFAIHPTSLSMKWTQISGDSKGYAQYRFEQKMGSKPTDPKPFVAAFANSNTGDVVSSDGNAYSAPGYEGSPDELLNAKKAGDRQAAKAEELWASPALPLVGPVDFRARWVKFDGYTVGAEYTQGAGAQKLCTPARGFSFASGGENGPSNIPGIYEGMTKGTFSLTDAVNKVDRSALGTMVRAAMGSVSVFFQDPCQAEKPVLLPSGAWGWAPRVMPVQLIRIGNVAVVAVPGEPTTMAGRRLRATVAEQLKGTGVDTVIVSSMANTYTGYVSTREEFAAQHYEGASTEFGPHELGAFQQEYTRLATAMRKGTSVADDVQPPDHSGRKFLERPGVVLDDKPADQQFGTVLTQPKGSYTRGETASAVFRGAHPKNNLRTMDTFLEVQRLENGTWTTYLTDRDWDTSFLWAREGASFSRTTVQWRIPQDAPAGTYRLVQKGDWKNGWNGRITPYTGTSATFTVR